MSYDESWHSEFHKFVSAKDRVQDISLNQLKHKVNDIYKKDEKLTSKFEAVRDEHVRKKGTQIQIPAR